MSLLEDFYFYYHCFSAVNTLVTCELSRNNALYDAIYE